MPNHRSCPPNWTLAFVTVLLCGTWLLDPTGLDASSSNSQANLRQGALTVSDEPLTHSGDAGTSMASQVAPAGRQPRAVPPVGWRRTTRGWERMPLVPPPAPSINEQISRQRRVESQWAIYDLLDRVAGLHPIGLAAAEITIACLIALAARRQTSAAAEDRQTSSAHLTAGHSTPAQPVPHTS